MTTLTIPTTDEWISAKHSYEAENGLTYRRYRFQVSKIHPQVGERQERFIEATRRGAITSTDYTEIIVSWEDDLEEGDTIEVTGERFEMNGQLMLNTIRCTKVNPHNCNCNRCNL